MENKTNLLAYNNPLVTEKSDSGGERQYDLYSKLMKDRIIFIGTVIDSATANGVIAQLIYLNHVSQEPIQIYINSPGGSVVDGLAIYDMMQNCSCPIYTVAMGNAASMGSLLLCAGDKGHRMVFPNAKVMIHQPLVRGQGLDGQVTDIQIQAAELVKTKERLIKIYEKHTGQPYEKLLALMERDLYLLPQEAKDLGLIDSIKEPVKK